MKRSYKYQHVLNNKEGEMEIDKFVINLEFEKFSIRLNLSCKILNVLMLLFRNLQ